MLPLINKIQLSGRLRSWRGAMLVTFVFLTAASFLFWLDFFRAYETEMRILAIGRSTIPSAEITENLVEIGGTLSFYERVLAQHEDLEDKFAGMKPDERKRGWQSLVK